MPRYWIVICPEPEVRGGVWARWYQDNCVAVGWGPPDNTLEGPTDSAGWAWSRDRLKEMQVGDKVLPFLLKWRIGPVGTIKALKTTDAEWNPTVKAGEYARNPDAPDLGRRVQVAWEEAGMPPKGKIATVPPSQRSKGPLARHTVEELSKDQFENLRTVLSDSSNWADVSAPGIPDVIIEAAVPQVGPELSVLEKDLQKFLSRNLHVIEPGLKAHPDYQLEEFPTDVGRIDLLCQDVRSNWVVIELKAAWAGDDAVGQILGYMSWIQENLPKGTNLRGIIICADATGRIKSAVKLVPGLSIKRFRLSFSVEDLN